MNKETMELLEGILGPEREEEGPRLSREGARELYEDMRELMFFDYYHKDRDESLVERILQRAESRYESLPEEEGGKPPFRKFLEGIPSIRESLEKDVEAIYEGDPASHGKAEIVLAYPGFIAISAYRIAHHLLGLGFPFAARVISRVRICLPILITSFPLVFRRKGGQVLLRENVTRVMMEFHVCDVCVTRGCREDSAAFVGALARQR